MGRKNNRIGAHNFWGRESNIRRLESLLYEETEEASSETEETSVEIENSPKAEFIGSLEVKETPTPKKRIQSIKDYPENAIIMSMGPSSSGKTTFLRRAFDEKEIISYRDIQKGLSNEQQEEMSKQEFKKCNRKYFSVVSEALINNPNGKVIIDAECLIPNFRNAVYELAQKTGRPIFIITQSTSYKESVQNIKKRYKGLPYASTKRRRSRKALERTRRIFGRIHPNLEDELRKRGLLLDEYEGQVIDIMHGQKKYPKKEHSRD